MRPVAASYFARILLLLSSSRVQSRLIDSGYSLHLNGKQYATMDIGACGGGSKLGENLTMMAWLKLWNAEPGRDYFVMGTPASETGPHMILHSRDSESHLTLGTYNLWNAQIMDIDTLADCSGTNSTHVLGMKRLLPLYGLINKEWNHIAVAYDSAVHSTYINGELYHHCRRYNSAPWQGAEELNFISATEISIGMYDRKFGSANSKGFDGELDEVRMFNRALGMDEIVNSLSRSLAANEIVDMDALLYLDFDSQTLFDKSIQNSKEVIGDGKLMHKPHFRVSSAPVASGLLVLEHRVDGGWLSNATLKLELPLLHTTDLASVQLSFLDVRNGLRESGNNGTRLKFFDNCSSGSIDISALPTATAACALGLRLFVEGAIHMQAPTVTIATINMTASGPTILTTTFMMVVKMKRNTAPKAGHGRRAIRCDGNNDFLYNHNFEWPIETFHHADRTPTVGGRPITIEWWAKVDTDSAQDSALMSIGASEFSNEWVGSFDPYARTGRFVARLPFSNGEVDFWIGTSSTLKANVQKYYGLWTHFAITHDQANGTRMAILINGEVVSEVLRRLHSNLVFFLSQLNHDRWPKDLTVIKVLGRCRKELTSSWKVTEPLHRHSPPSHSHPISSVLTRFSLLFNAPFELIRNEAAQGAYALLVVVLEVSSTRVASRIMFLRTQ
jgi:hypothetical protein